MKSKLALTFIACSLVFSSAVMAGVCDNFEPVGGAGDTFCYTNDTANVTLPSSMSIADFDKVTQVRCNLYSSKMNYASGQGIKYQGGDAQTITKGGSGVLKACTDGSACHGWSDLSAGKQVMCGSNQFKSSSGQQKVYSVKCPYSGSISLDRCTWTEQNARPF